MKGKRKVIVNRVKAREPNLPRDVLKRDFTVKQLKARCKQLGISGYSKLREDELVDLIYKTLNSTPAQIVK